MSAIENLHSTLTTSLEWEAASCYLVDFALTLVSPQDYELFYSIAAKVNYLNIGEKSINEELAFVLSTDSGLEIRADDIECWRHYLTPGGYQYLINDMLQRKVPLPVSSWKDAMVKLFPGSGYAQNYEDMLAAVEVITASMANEAPNQMGVVPEESDCGAPIVHLSINEEDEPGYNPGLTEPDGPCCTLTVLCDDCHPKRNKCGIDECTICNNEYQPDPCDCAGCLGKLPEEE